MDNYKTSATIQPLFLEESQARWRDSDERTAIGNRRFHEAAAGSVFPDGQSRTGGARNPFDEVKNQIFDAVSHGCDIAPALRFFNSRWAAGEKGDPVFSSDGVSQVWCCAVIFAEKFIKHRGHGHH